MIEMKMILFEYKIFHDRPNLIITNLYENLIKKYFLCKEDRHLKFIEIEKSKIYLHRQNNFLRKDDYIENSQDKIFQVKLYYITKKKKFEINRNRNPDISEISFNRV